MCAAHIRQIKPITANSMYCARTYRKLHLRRHEHEITPYLRAVEFKLLQQCKNVWPLNSLYRHTLRDQMWRRITVVDLRQLVSDALSQRAVCVWLIQYIYVLWYRITGWDKTVLYYILWETLYSMWIGITLLRNGYLIFNSNTFKIW